MLKGEGWHRMEKVEVGGGRLAQNEEGWVGGEGKTGTEWRRSGIGVDGGGEEDWLKNELLLKS